MSRNERFILDLDIKRRNGKGLEIGKGDAEWFEENREELRRVYEKEYIAVYGCAVLAHAEEKNKLYKRVRARYGKDLSFYIGFL